MKSLPCVNRQPLYEQVRQVLLKSIQSGLWGPGEKIPTEPELAKQLGVSIGTLRRAVETLANDGVLQKREGAGTYVRTYRGGGYWNAFQIYKNLDGKKRGNSSRLITFEVLHEVGEKIRSTLNLEKNQPIIHIIRHWLITAEDGQEEIISVDESYLISEKFPSLSKDYFLQNFKIGESLYEFFDREFSVVIISQKCSAHYEKLSEETAKKLKVPKDFEALCTERISQTFGHIPVEYRINRGRVDVTKIFFDLN